LRSEDQLGIKWDRCVADTLIKMGGGLTLGAVFSLMLFKRRAWPVTFGLGAGFGMGYAHCQHSFNEPYMVRADRVKVRTGATEPPAAPETESLG